MKNFYDIIAPLLEKKYRVTNINVKVPRTPVDRKGGPRNKAVITPLGSFISVSAAAKAHKVTPSTIITRIVKLEGYRYA